MISEDTSLRDKVMENAEYFSTEMKAKGFDIPDGDAAIVPVMLYDALAQKMAEKMMDEGIYVIGFFYPVVPKGKARIRVQLSAAHTREHLIKPLLLSKK
jgi:glycine C-acetyltransferase